jgi:hypothetical protein
LYLHTYLITGENMTNDEIRELAQQAGFRWGFIKAEGLMDGMIDFAKLVAQHEREACARLCDEHNGWSARMIAEAIRARGQA